MTALTKYERLEATGVWREHEQAQRRDVIVSLGDATLTITDQADRALAHWSLPALHRLNPGTRPALLAPSDGASEQEILEIADDEMVDAIERVRKAIARRRPRQGRLRLAVSALVFLGLGAGAVGWLPGALTRQTLSVLPDVARESVGERLLMRIQRVTGAPCADPAGRAALDQLDARVRGATAGHALVVPDGVDPAIHLPGGIVVFHRRLIEEAQEPDVAAGFLLTESLRALETDPMRPLLDHAGFLATARLLTSGHLPDAVLDSYAETLLTAPPDPLDPELVLAAFAGAELRSTPYAFALDPSGETTLALIESDPVPRSRALPLLPDSAWVALQGICTE